jgi:LacI family transcriptional regulator
MRPKSERATIKEVASAAGVSTQTVSRVLNERPDVSAETRQRVQEVIQQMGYQPSALARSLIQQRSHTLGVVTAGLKYIGPSRTLSGIASAAEQAGYSVLMKELPRFDAQDVRPIFRALTSRHVDGIIWAVPEVGSNRAWIREAQLDLAVPLVFLTMEAQQGIPVVSVDNYLGGQIATAHLIEQGYRQVGHISGPLDWWEARQRMSAWRDTLIGAGLNATESAWVEGNWSSASGGQAAQLLFRQYPQMDAVFAANDQMALSVLREAHRLGRRVPQDLGVIGFDDIPESEYFWPALSTMQQDQYHVAKVAVQELIQIIDSGREGVDRQIPQPIRLAPSLVVRESSSRPTT